MNENRDDIIKRAADMLPNEGAREVYVFGSRANGEHGEDADLDSPWRACRRSGTSGRWAS